MPKRSKVSGSRVTSDGTEHLDGVELEARICRLICDGKHPGEIKKILAEGTPPILINRQQPYSILQKAAKDKRLEYRPHHSFFLEDKIRENHVWLRDVKVVHSKERTDVAVVAADKLLKMILEHGKSVDKGD